MKIHQLTIGELLASVHSNMQGLTTEEANRRLLEFGSNIINKAKRETTASRFFKGFTHFFAIILWCGSAFAFLGEWMQPGGGMAMLGWAILGVIVINALFSFWQEFRAEQAISALEKLIPHQVKVLRDGKLTQLPSAALVPGDVISIEEGDNVPADCRLLEGFGVRVNNATLTGESVPLSRDASVSEQDDLKNSKNVLLAGTSVFAGQGKAVVFHTGMHTEFGKIAGLTQEIVPGLSPLQKEISRLSRVIAAIAVSMGLLLFLVGQLIGMSLLDDFVLALGIIVALVPEGLLPEVTLVLATCSQRMAKRNALIRHLPSVETLGCATVICTDKTGTLTQNKMSCKRMFLFDGFTEQADMRNPGQQRAAQMLSRISLGCNNVKNSMEENQERLLGDPMEIALVEFAQQSSASEPAAVRIDEVPFDSDRKRLSTIHRIEGRKILYTKGAAELLLPLCTRVCTAGSDQLFSDSQ